MKDIVIITSFWRAEFLHLCLKSLYECPDSRNKEIWLIQDFKVGNGSFGPIIEDLNKVAGYWKDKFGPNLILMVRPPNTFYGNSYNVLSAYNKAYKTDAKNVYLIEDDVLISPDFFKWHEAVQRDGDWFCTIAGRSLAVRKPDVKYTENDYFISHEYRSLGVCWPRHNLESIVKHYDPIYYATQQNMVDYVYSKFPNSAYGITMIEQDGLISRIMEEDDEYAAWAGVPRARHIGVWGYHRSIGVENMLDHPSLESRIEGYRVALDDPKWVEQVAGFQTDIDPVLPEVTTGNVNCVNTDELWTSD